MMDNYYSREFMSSSQTAAKLVFNIENCVDMTRVIHCRPTRPPDSHGREAFVYLMDGAATNSVKDLTLDDLSPWNSRKCKSSTRFSSVQFDNERNSLVFNRYIISDTSAYTPDCLFACYYCKHPVFDLVKKIFYACDGNRERCLPGTFVIFVYEFNQAERLYRTQRYVPSSKPTGTFLNIGGGGANPAASSSAASLATTMPSFQPPPQLNQFPNPTTSSPAIPSTVRHFLESSSGPLKLENFSEWGDPMVADDQSSSFSGYDFDGLPHSASGADLGGNTTSGSTCLEDILQSCTESMQQQLATTTTGASSAATNGFGAMGAVASSAPSSGMMMQMMDPHFMNNNNARKRRKITFRALDSPGDLVNFGNKCRDPMDHHQSNISSPSSLVPVDRSSAHSSVQSGEQPQQHRQQQNGDEGGTNGRGEEIRHVFTSDALLENFRRNCLCDGRQLGELLEAMDERFLQAADGEETARAAISEGEGESGGCLLVDSELAIGPDLRATFLWFRNPSFLDGTVGQPVVHPVAVHLTNAPRSSANNGGNDGDRQFLLDELKRRLCGGGESSSRICRSVLIRRPSLRRNDGAAANSANNLDSWSLQSELFTFPCIRIVSQQQSRSWIRQKFSTAGGTADEADRVEAQLFQSGTGVMESRSFEQFVSRQRAVERGWPNAFRSWFREKSGWIFEHCSLGSRLKAGFSGSMEFDLDATLEPWREEVRQSFAATVQQGTKLELETATEAMELICTEFLRKALNALLDPLDGTSTSVVPAKRTSWVGRDQWEQLSMKEKHDRLSPLGLSSLLNIADSLDPTLFWSLSCAQKRAMIARANSLTVMEISPASVENGNEEAAVKPSSSSSYVVFSRTKRIANFVQAIESDAPSQGGGLYCQCRPKEDAIRTLCEHILAAAIKHPGFAKIVAKLLSANRNGHGGILGANNGCWNSSTPPTPPPPVVQALQLHSTESVEIICCSSSNGSSSH